MDREAWRAAIHGVAKSQTWLSDWTELNWTEHKHALITAHSILTLDGSNAKGLIYTTQGNLMAHSLACADGTSHSLCHLHPASDCAFLPALFPEGPTLWLPTCIPATWHPVTFGPWRHQQENRDRRREQRPSPPSSGRSSPGTGTASLSPSGGPAGLCPASSPGLWTWSPRLLRPVSLPRGFIWQCPHLWATSSH